MNEKSLQAWCVKQAKAAGWRVTVNTASGLHSRGEPDITMVAPRPDTDLPRAVGRVAWVEFKTPTGKLTRLQVSAINDLIDRGQEAYVCRDKDTFLAILSGQADCGAVALRGSARRQ